MKKNTDYLKKIAGALDVQPCAAKRKDTNQQNWFVSLRLAHCFAGMISFLL